MQRNRLSVFMLRLKCSPWDLVEVAVVETRQCLRIRPLQRRSAASSIDCFAHSDSLRVALIPEWESRCPRCQAFINGVQPESPMKLTTQWMSFSSLFSFAWLRIVRAVSSASRWQASLRMLWFLSGFSHKMLSGKASKKAATAVASLAVTALIKASFSSAKRENVLDRKMCS